MGIDIASKWIHLSAAAFYLSAGEINKNFKARFVDSFSFSVSLLVFHFYSRCFSFFHLSFLFICALRLLPKNRKIHSIMRQRTADCVLSCVCVCAYVCVRVCLTALKSRQRFRVCLSHLQRLFIERFEWLKAHKWMHVYASTSAAKTNVLACMNVHMFVCVSGCVWQVERLCYGVNK